MLIADHLCHDPPPPHTHHQVEVLLQQVLMRLAEGRDNGGVEVRWGLGLVWRAWVVEWGRKDLDN